MYQNIIRTFSLVNYKYEEYSALFNTFAAEEVRDGDSFEVTFDRTMRTPPYLIGKFSTVRKKPVIAFILFSSHDFLAMVISDYQIDTVFEESPETNTIVRIPGPDYIIKDKLGDYALEKAQKVIDGFSEVIS